MFTPESAKLKILPGNIYSEDHAIIYEVDSTLQRVVLPFESQIVIELLLEKDRSISELVAEMKQRYNGVISYKNLFFTTDRLITEGIVYSADAEAPPYFDDSQVRLVNGLTMDFVLAPKMIIPHMVRQKFFFALCVTIILGGFYGLTTLIENGFTTEFLLIRGRYDSGFFFALIFFSVLMTLKTVLQVVLNLTGWGRAYEVSLRVSPLSCALRLNDTYLYATSRRMVAFLYGAASSFSYFFIAGIANNFILSETTGPHVFTLAALLTLFDLSPLNNGEIRKFARSLVSEEDNDHLRPFYETQMLRSLFKFNGTAKSFYIYSKLVVAYSLLGMWMLLYLAYENAPHLLEKLAAEDMAQRTGAGIVSIMLLVPFVYLCTDLVSAIFKTSLV